MTKIHQVIALALLQTSLLQSISTSAVAAGEPELSGSQGYLLIDSQVGRTATSWRLNRSVVIDVLPLGRSSQLIVLKAGSYQWQEIGIPHYDLPHRYDVSEDKRWAFTITAQAINYAGTLVVDEDRATDSVNVKYLNRSSEALEILEANYPELAARYPLVYAGYYRDDFLELMGQRQ